MIHLISALEFNAFTNPFMNAADQEAHVLICKGSAGMERWPKAKLEAIISVLGLVWHRTWVRHPASTPCDAIACQSPV